MCSVRDGPRWVCAHRKDVPFGHLGRSRRNRAETIILRRLFHKELLRGAAFLFSFFAGDSNPIVRLDSGYLSDKSVNLSIAFARELQPAWSGTSAANDPLAAMSHREVDSNPDPHNVAPGRDSKLTDNPLATALQTVARIISGSGGLGVTRQIFYMQLGSFDTHNNRAIQHAQLLTQLGHELDYFDGLMVSAGLGNQATTFTASDFGRTLTCISNGTDHGWGSHHFVVGGAVQGQDMYGQYPVIGVSQANDVGAGRLIPTTAVDQYAGTLACWFGLSDGQVRQVFPNLGNFGSSPYLGFMG